MTDTPDPRPRTERFEEHWCGYRSTLGVPEGSRWECECGCRYVLDGSAGFKQWVIA